MGTFAYAPGIRVLIESEFNGIIDVSGDLVDWTVSRRSNTVSSFNFTLQNTQRKYDGMFRPGDRLTVELKRVTWCRVFTGTLNTSPVFSAWPRALPMSASCSLKKLQFWPWDPTTQAANALVQKYIPLDASSQNTVGDGGLSNLIADAMILVTGWDKSAIHIGEVPATWFKWAIDLEKKIDLSASMASVLGATAIVSGQSVTPGSFNLPAGFQSLNAAQLKNAAAVYAVVISTCVKFNILNTASQDRLAQIAFMTCMTEESGAPFSNSGVVTDHTSVGMFQQQTNWGSTAQRLDPTHETQAFLGALPESGKSLPGGVFQKYPNWTTATDLGAVCQATQVSAFPDRYDAHASQALDMVKQCRTQLDAATAAGITKGSVLAGTPTPTPTSLTTGSAYASFAVNYILQNPSLRYVTPASPFKLTDPKQQVFDCSAFTSWVYYQTTGQYLLGVQNSYPTSQAQYSGTQDRRISASAAFNIQGAILFSEFGQGSGPGPDHVAISVGDGVHYVAANTDSNPPGQQVSIFKLADTSGLSLFTGASLAPGIDYSQAATSQAALNVLQGAGYPKATMSSGGISTNALNPGASAFFGDPTATNPFQAAIQVATTIQSVSGNIFGGPRKFIHNQPFLPWLKNIVNSSMRAFSSSPSGDFMAWFPDYFDLTGTSAKMTIETIELMDFTVDWSDQQIVTHEFVTGALVSGFDQASGSIVQADNSYTGLYQMLLTNGIATLDNPDIFKTLFGYTPSQQFVTDYLTRFGVRPNVDSMPNIHHGQMEFCMALWNFMYYWSAQFNATIPMTFMPELWPGMIIQIPEYNFQAYVTQVDHHGSFGQGGQFTTTAQIIAPAQMDNKSNMFGMFKNILPSAQGKKIS